MEDEEACRVIGGDEKDEVSPTTIVDSTTEATIYPTGDKVSLFG